MKVGDRVKTKYDFLSDGNIKEVVDSWNGALEDAYIVKLDEKAPNKYAWNTDEVFMWAGDLELMEVRK